MGEYTIIFARSARKELESLSDRLGERILDRIEGLATDPRPQRCAKLVGADDLWRIRVGDYRVIYAINDGEQLIDVIAVRHRKDAYSG
jgi:mRNA interferase RelE/StbE